MADPIKMALARLAEAERLVAEARELLGATQKPGSSSGSTSPAQTPAQTAEDQKKDADPVTSLFRLVSSPPGGEEALREALRAILHPDIASNDRAMDGLIRFNWTRFTRQYTDYLADPGDPGSYTVSGEQGRTLAEHREKKIFLEAAGRNPAPVALRSVDGTWMLYSFSL